MCNRCSDSNQEHVHAGPSRREALIAGAALVAAPFLRGLTSTVPAAQAANTGGPVGRPKHAQAGKVQEWLSYGGDKAGWENLPVPQKRRGNFKPLKVPWDM